MDRRKWGYGAGMNLIPSVKIRQERKCDVCIFRNPSSEGYGYECSMMHPTEEYWDGERDVGRDCVDNFTDDEMRILIDQYNSKVRNSVSGVKRNQKRK